MVCCWCFDYNPGPFNPCTLFLVIKNVSAKLIRSNRRHAKFRFKSNSNRLLRSDFSYPIESSRRFDSNSDSDFKLGFNLYQKLVEFNQKLLKTTKLLI